MKTSFLYLLLLVSCTTVGSQEEKQADLGESSVQTQLASSNTAQEVDEAEANSAPNLTSRKAKPSVYAWLKEEVSAENTLAGRIAAPAGYQRVSVEEGSFAYWLRHLPLHPENTPVKYHDGQLKSQQHLHEAVILIDVGRRDLQQCADAVMRLRAEYQYSQGLYDQIGFKFTNGDPAPFKHWKEGKRISIQNNRLVWQADARNNSSHESFRKYMDQIFTYAGTASLSKELQSVPDLREMQIGDVFIKGGFPGHAVLVVDMAENPATGEKVFMVVQSYMPAQSIHLLKNFHNPSLGAWYSIKDCLEQGEVSTPQWLFQNNELKRF